MSVYTLSLNSRCAIHLVFSHSIVTLPPSSKVMVPYKMPVKRIHLSNIYEFKNKYSVHTVDAYVNIYIRNLKRKNKIIALTQQMIGLAKPKTERVKKLVSTFTVGIWHSYNIFLIAVKEQQLGFAI